MSTNLTWRHHVSDTSAANPMVAAVAVGEPLVLQWYYENALEVVLGVRVPTGRDPREQIHFGAHRRSRV